MLSSVRIQSVIGEKLTPETFQKSILFHFLRNRAIADYLRSNGYEEAYSTFKKEAELDMVRQDRCLKISE